MSLPQPWIYRGFVLSITTQYIEVIHFYRLGCSYGNGSAVQSLWAKPNFMLKFSCTVLFLSVLISCSSSSERITVIGQAQMKVVPDMVEVSLKAYNVKPSMKEAVSETTGAVNEMIAVCRRFVKDGTDIKVSNISTNKTYEYRNGREVFIGYDAQQVLDVTLKDITRIEEFTEALLATKVSRIDNIRYNHTKADSLLREINLLALEDARQSAEKMCGKMNVQLGKITYLSNHSGQPSTNVGAQAESSDYEMNLYNKGFGGRGFKMTTEILQFQQIAYAAFEIK
jgi:uncharacterized protein YggE